MTEDEYFEAWFGGRKLFSITFHGMDDDVWESLNLHGSPQHEKPRRRKKRTRIPNGAAWFPDEDDESLPKPCDRVIEDTITDTTIEEFLER